MATRYKIYREGGTDVAVADGGTGASTAADAFNNLKQAATETATGVVEKSTSAENITGTATDKFPDVAGVKEMIDTHAGGGGGASNFVRAYVSSNQAISASTNTVVDYDTETYDTGGDFNTTTNTYTCPSAGKYYVHAVAQISNTFANSTRYDLEVQKNSTTIAETFHQTSSAGGVMKKSMQITSVVDCAINDTLRINVNFGSGNDIEAGSALSWLEIYKIA